MIKRFAGNLTNKRREKLAYISLLICVMSYGAAFLAMKVVLLEYNPITMITFRMIIAACIFLPLLKTAYSHIKIQKEDIKLLILMILCEPCLYFLFESHALTFTTSSQAGIVNSLLPVFITIGAVIVLKEKVPLIAYLGFGLALTGSVILSYTSPSTEIAPNPLLGNFLELIAVIMTATSIIATKFLMEKYPPFFLAAFQTVAGSIFYTILNFSTGSGFELHWSVSLLIIIYLGCVTVSDYALYNFAMCTLSASKASAFLFLQPVFSIILGIIFLNEYLNNMQIFSVVLIFIGLIISQKNAIKKARRVVKTLRTRIKNEISLMKFNK